MGTNAIQQRPAAATLEQVLVGGDLGRLTPEQRVEYYNLVCSSVGLNPLTRPFDYINLSGKLTLYAKRDCTDQLRKIHGVSVTITARDMSEGVYVVTARATDKDGRTDESTGAVAVGNLKGEALANALMKAETKAKRRVTLSICGLGLLDESEIEDANRAATETAHKEEDDDPLGDDSAASWKEYEKKAKASKSKEELDKLNDLAKKITDPALRTKAQRLYSQLRKKFTEQTAAPESKDPEQEETA